MTDLPRYVLPREYARVLGVSEDKVRGWIHRGELRAIDVSELPGLGRPRWRIPPDAIVEFESRRAATKPAKRSRRRKRDSAVLDIIK